MNGYLLGVIGTVLVCSLMTAIAPEGKTSSVIKGIARLACILAIIAPVLSFFKTGNLMGFDENRDIFFSESVIGKEAAYIQYYSELRIAEAEKALSAELNEKYSVSVEVQLAWSLTSNTFFEKYETQEVKIDCIKINAVKETNEEVKEAMRLYLKEKYCSEVLIE